MKESEENPYFEKLIHNRYKADQFILAKGGIGFVFKAEDIKEKKEVVIKVLQNHLVKDFWVMNKFRSEARAILRIHELKDDKGQVKYTNEEKIGLNWIVKAIEAGELEDSNPYLVMEFIDGVTLRTLIEKSNYGISLERAANILKQLVIALSIIHKNGIYHRDLKPDNIMIVIDEYGKENIKLIDFGIATVKESPDEKTNTATLPVGTIPYMAQEQIMGRPSASSDIYAMGVIAYELLTGRRPFYVDQSDGIYPAIKFYTSQQEGVKVKPTVLRRYLTEEIDKLIVKSLAFEPKSRFAIAEEFGNLLYKALIEAEQNIRSQSPEIVPKTRFEENLPKTCNENIVDNQQKIGDKLPSKKVTKTYPYYLISFALVLVMAMFLVIKFSSKNNNVSRKSISTTNLVNNKPTPTFNMKLSHRVELQRFNNNKYTSPVVLIGKTSFSDKDRIKFEIKVDQEGYVYLLNESPEKLENGLVKYLFLFPGQKENNKVSANKMIKLPTQDGPGLQFIGSKGIEKIWIIWSQEKQPILEETKLLLNSKDKGIVKNKEQIDFLMKLIEKYNLKAQENEKDNFMEVFSSNTTVVTLISLIHQ